MISAFLLPAWLALIPIIFIEARLGVRIANLSVRQSTYGAIVGNLFSTLLGIPITWSILVAIEMRWFGVARGLDTFFSKVYAVTLQSPWLIPYEESLVWMIPVATIFLAFIFWMMSIVSEYLILRIILRKVQPAILWKWMWIANTASYVFLLLFLCLLTLAKECLKNIYF